MDMKKILAVAAAVVGTTVMADIVSSSVVGYTAKKAEQGKFIIMGAQLERLTDTGRDMKINGLVTGLTGVVFDSDGLWLDTASQIQVPSAAGYITYRYLDDGWYYDGTAAGARKAGWCDGSGNITDHELTPAIAQWVKSVPDSGSATVSGGVSDEDVATIDCPEGFALRANAFPVPIALNTSSMTSADIVGVNFDSDGAWRDTAPQIQVPSTTGYTTYFYLNDGWYDDGITAGTYKAGWCDGSGNIVSNTIAVAQGFWTKGVTGKFTLKFAK